MKSIIVAMLALFSSFTLANEESNSSLSHLLYFEQMDVYAYVVFDEAPTLQKNSPMILELKDHLLNEVNYDDYSINVVLWLPSSERGTFPTKLIHQLDENGEVISGKYLVDNVWFNQPGEWEVRIYVTNFEGETEIRSFTLVF